MSDTILVKDKYLKKPLFKPIFLIGPGRSGSTLLHNLLALHPDVAWISNWTARFISFPQLSFLSRFNDIRHLEKATRRLRFWPRPTEAYSVWDFYIPGFSDTNHDLSSPYNNFTTIYPLREFASEHLKWQGKQRLIFKYTGWPRIGLIRAIFPEACFIYLDRDPRAVVYSYYKKKWRWNDLSKREYVELNKDELLTYYSNRYLRYYEAKCKYSKSLYLQIYYEDLVDNVDAVISKICDYADLPIKYEFMQIINTIPINKNANHTYQEYLNEQEILVLNSLLINPIIQMHYQL